MRMSIPAAALALPALAVSLAAVAAPADGAATPPAKATVENTTAAASLIVVRDRATGKLRAPTPEEVEKLMASGRHSTVKREPRDVRSIYGFLDRPGLRGRGSSDDDSRQQSRNQVAERLLKRIHAVAPHDFGQ